MANDLIVVSMDGFRSIARSMVDKRGFGIVGGELWQNAMDEKPQRVDFTIEPIEGKPAVHVRVEDDGPGYQDLSHAWTLYAPSAKKDDPEKAGRFNRGCKIVLCFCREATIHTTSGLVQFSRSKGREVFPRRKREKGTVFDAEMDCTREQYDQLMTYMRQILPPLEARVNPVRLFVNGEEVIRRTPVGTFMESLPTEIGEDLHRTVRKCSVQIHRVHDGETPHIYELGIPVVPIECKWHVNVLQKIPLNTDRDNVLPAYRKNLLAYVLNQMHAHLDEQDVQQAWTTEATDSEKCEDRAMEAYLDKKFGEKRTVFDLSDPEANNRAVAEGYTVIPSRALTSGQREHVRSNVSLARPSGHVFPTSKPYSDDPNAPVVKVLEESKLTEGMKLVRSYAVALAEELMGVQIKVQFVTTSNGFAACYGGRALDFNVRRLGKAWFEGGRDESKDRLLIHEFGHEFESNHLDEKYHDALCQLGAKMVALALTKPEFFKRFEE